MRPVFCPDSRVLEENLVSWREIMLPEIISAGMVGRVSRIWGKGFPNRSGLNTISVSQSEVCNIYTLLLASPELQLWECFFVKQSAMPYKWDPVTLLTEGWQTVSNLLLAFYSQLVNEILDNRWNKAHVSEWMTSDDGIVDVKPWIFLAIQSCQDTSVTYLFETNEKWQRTTYSIYLGCSTSFPKLLTRLYNKRHVYICAEMSMT